MLVHLLALGDADSGTPPPSAVSMWCLLHGGAMLLTPAATQQMHSSAEELVLC